MVLPGLVSRCANDGFVRSASHIMDLFTIVLLTNFAGLVPCGGNVQSMTRVKTWVE
ncbi:hypothetical protein FHT86_005368 [Rhizobium sp. BK313]|jgi:hypothetical protein|nr:hypothetical protein [Rhizobium sp. BK313]